MIDLSAGELDFATPPHIVEAAVRAATDIDNHRYGPAAGLPALRDAIAADAGQRMSADVAQSQVGVTNGAKQALFNTLLSILGSGGQVLVPAPYWVSFPAMVTLAGGTPSFVPPDPETLRVTVADLERAVTTTTRALILVSPHNPTGAVYEQTEVVEIAEWAATRELWLIMDETYSRLTYGTEALSPAAVYPGVTERLVSIGSVSKAYAMTGWRVGWLVAPPALIKQAAAIQSHTTSNVNQIAQHAALAALTGPDVTAVFRERLQRRRDRAVAVLADVLDTCPSPAGAFYLFIRPTTRDGLDDVSIAAQLLDTAGIVTVPGHSFGHSGHLRISYAVDDQLLDDGVQQLASYLRSAR